jgi:hypothetical protein
MFKFNSLKVVNDWRYSLYKSIKEPSTHCVRLLTSDHVEFFVQPLILQLSSRVFDRMIRNVDGCKLFAVPYAADIVECVLELMHLGQVVVRRCALQRVEEMLQFYEVSSGNGDMNESISDNVIANMNGILVFDKRVERGANAVDNDEDDGTDGSFLYREILATVSSANEGAGLERHEQGGLVNGSGATSGIVGEQGVHGGRSTGSAEAIGMNAPVLSLAGAVQQRGGKPSSFELQRLMYS